jgi:hypothetical protein
MNQTIEKTTAMNFNFNQDLFRFYKKSALSGLLEIQKYKTTK